MPKKNLISLDDVSRLDVSKSKNKILDNERLLSASLSRVADYIRDKGVKDDVLAVKNAYSSPYFDVASRSQILENGKENAWAYSVRPSGKEPVATMIKSKKDGKFLFIAQPRVSLKKIILSFPAGLRDASDPNGFATAIRETKEETGFEITRKNITSYSNPTAKSPGITSEVETLVQVEIPTIKSGESIAKPEETEDIKAFWATPEQYISLVEHADPKKMISEIGPYNYMKGYVSGKQEICDKLKNTAKYAELYNSVCIF